MIKTRFHVEIGLNAAIMIFLAAMAGQTQPRDNPLERARHNMELGQEAFSQGRYIEAADQFIDAYAAAPFSAFLYNAGLAYEKAEDTEKTIEFFRRYLEAEPDARDYAQVDMKIRALLAGAETPPQTGVQATGVEMKSLISVRTNPPDATVRILNPKGKEIAQATGPAAQTVEKGTYTIEASHPDFRTVQTDLHVMSGQVYIVIVEMSQGAFLGFVGVKTDIPGAAVYLDDMEAGQVGITPWSNVLPTGKHTIWIEKPGYKPIKENVDVALGEQLDLSLNLERLQFGTVLIKTNAPGSKLFIDEQFVGVAPLEKRLRPGQHKLKVVSEKLKDYETYFVVSKGQRTKILVRLNSKPSRTSAWVSLGFAAGLFAAGGTMGILALRTNNELDNLRNTGRLANDDPRIVNGFVLALAADISFGVGAIVSGLCIYYFLRDPLPPSEGKLSDPADFTENPDDVGIPSKTPKDKHPGEPPTKVEARRGPKLFFTPLLSSEIAGLSMIVVF